MATHRWGLCAQVRRGFYPPDGHQTCVVRFGHALVGTSRTRTIGTSRTMPRTYLLWSFLLCAAAPWAAGHLVVGTAAPMSWMSSPKPPLLRQCSALDGPVARLRGGCASGLSGYIDNAKTWNPILLALIGTTFGWFMTALGSAMVVVHGLGLSEVSYRKARLTRPPPRRPRRPCRPLLPRHRERDAAPCAQMLDAMLGVSAGVMTAASVRPCPN